MRHIIFYILLLVTPGGGVLIYIVGYHDSRTRVGLEKQMYVHGWGYFNQNICTWMGLNKKYNFTGVF